MTKSLRRVFLWLSTSLLHAVMMVSPAKAEEGAPLRGLGADTTVEFPMGAEGDIMEPAIGGRLAFGWPVVWDALSVGAVVGWQSQTGAHHDVLSAKLSTKTFAFRVQGIVGSLEWATVPFIGIDMGMARMALRTTVQQFGENEVDAPPVRTTSNSNVNGLLLAPEAGLWTVLGYGLGLKVSVRYQAVIASESLEIGNTWLRTVGGAGLSMGVYYRFQ